MTTSTAPKEHEKIVLRVRGHDYAGWTAIKVEQSMETLSGSFGFVAADMPLEEYGPPKGWDMVMGDECKVVIGDTTLLTGHIDTIVLSYDARRHSIEISGRDKTADLVDCAYDGKTREWINKSVQQIVKDLCKPFGIDVDVDQSAQNGADAKIRKFQYNEGETVRDAIVRACQMEEVMPISYGDGFLSITRAGRDKCSGLDLGKNILSGRLLNTDRQRFYTYVVKGQDRGPEAADIVWDLVKGGMGGGGSTKGAPSARVIDSASPRTERVTVILSDAAADQARCQKRADWEARVRAGSARTVEYMVHGWVQGDGKTPWRLNVETTVTDRLFGLDGRPLLVERIEFLQDDTNGTRTRLGLTHRAKYDILRPAEEIEEAIGDGWQAKAAAEQRSAGKK